MIRRMPGGALYQVELVRGQVYLTPVRRLASGQLVPSGARLQMPEDRCFWDAGSRSWNVGLLRYAEQQYDIELMMQKIRKEISKSQNGSSPQFRG